jgi:hypothetical protein
MAKLEACKEKVREEHVDEEELGEALQWSPWDASSYSPV